MIRVTGPEPAYTRTVKSLAWAEERAYRVALLSGVSEIQRKDSGQWVTLQRFERVGSRVNRVSGKKRAIW